MFKSNVNVRTNNDLGNNDYNIHKCLIKKKQKVEKKEMIKRTKIQKKICKIILFLFFNELKMSKWTY